MHILGCFKMSLILFVGDLKLGITLKTSKEVFSRTPFSEKIVKQLVGFTCKLWNFATAILLKAKTHASNCGEKRRKFKTTRLYKCTECSETFVKKKLLNKHFQTVHQIRPLVTSAPSVLQNMKKDQATCFTWKPMMLSFLTDSNVTCVIIRPEITGY